LKIALVSDIHFGCKKSDKIFLENQLSFFKNEFVKYLKDNNINNFVILGDLFDNRNTLNSYMYHEVYKLFEFFEKENLNIYMFPGNHDIYYRNTIEVHSLNFFKKFKNINVIEEITILDFDDKKLLFVPWQINYSEFEKTINEKELNCDVCLGHFDIVGFPFNKTNICDEGLQPNLLINNYSLTFSGHFHKRHVYRNCNHEVIMIGSPYQIDRGDKYENRGFCVLDIDSLKYEFIDSKNTIKFIDLNFPEHFDETDITGNVVDVNVNYDGNFIDDDIKRYIEEIENYKPAYTPNLFINNNLMENVNENYEIKSLSQMFDEFIGSLNVENKNEIKEIINDLYKKAKGE
jgi:DNA repair exonuclease SbcCD nuclease subunit